MSNRWCARCRGPLIGAMELYNPDTDEDEDVCIDCYVKTIEPEDHRCGYHCVSGAERDGS